MGHFTFLIIDILILLFPLIFSFSKKIHFISNLKFVIIGILINALVFIPWDMAFTAMKIWRFNTDYNLGVYLGNIPFEEFLYFITMPYLCLFIYEWLRVYIKRDYLRIIHFTITPVAIIGLIFLLSRNFEKTYTAFSCAMLTLLLLLQLINGRRYMGRFYLSYLVCLIPFLIVNGILTSLPVIRYNDGANLDISIGTIPADNFIYNAVLLLLMTMGYEWSRRKFNGDKAQTLKNKEVLKTEA